jgi:hypothetical protein
MGGWGGELTSTHIREFREYSIKIIAEGRFSISDPLNTQVWKFRMSICYKI